MNLMNDSTQIQCSANNNRMTVVPELSFHWSCCGFEFLTRWHLALQVTHGHVSAV